MTVSVMERANGRGLIDGLAWTGYQALFGTAFLGCATFSPLLVHCSRRIARGLPNYLGHLPTPPQGPLVWLHGVSQGEAMVAIGMAESLKRLNPNLRIGFTTTHPDVLAGAMKKKLLDTVGYAPIDFFPFIWQAMNRWKPRLIAIAETDFWPGLSVLARKRGIPLVLVNGRISEKLHRFYSRIPIFGRLIFESFSLLAVQSETDRRRLLEMGAVPETVRVLGNMKADLKPISAPEAIHCVSSWLDGSQLLIFGSLHPDEFRALLEQLPRLLRDIDCRILIAPRNPALAIEWQALLSQAGFEGSLRSEFTTFSATRNCHVADSKIMLLDTMGELGALYSLARLAFVGGSLDPKVGGHNPIEPLRFGVPTLVGPHTRNFSDLVEDLKNKEAIEICSSAFGLVTSLIGLFHDEVRSLGRAERAKAILFHHQGAVSRTLQALKRYLPAV